MSMWKMGSLYANVELKLRCKLLFNSMSILLKNVNCFRNWRRNSEHPGALVSQATSTILKHVNSIRSI